MAFTVHARSFRQRAPGIAGGLVRRAAKTGIFDRVSGRQLILVNSVAARSDRTKQCSAAALVDGEPACERNDAVVLLAEGVVTGSTAKRSERVGVPESPQWCHARIRANAPGRGRSRPVSPAEQADRPAAKRFLAAAEGYRRVRLGDRNLNASTSCIGPLGILRSSTGIGGLEKEQGAFSVHDCAPLLEAWFSGAGSAAGPYC